MTARTPETRAKWRAAIDQGTHFAPAHVATLLAALEEAERRPRQVLDEMKADNPHLDPEAWEECDALVSCIEAGGVAEHTAACEAAIDAREPEDTEP